MSYGYARTRPTVTASMIHEVRMVAQQLFSGWAANRQPRRTIFKEESLTSTLLCVRCLQADKTTPAVAMQKGTTLCKEHVINSVV